MVSYERPAIDVSFRIWTSLGVCLSCLLVLVLRLWYLQIVNGEYFRDRSENNRLRIVYLPSPRGLILDRNGEVLVKNRPSFNVDLVLEDCPDKEQTLTNLAAITGEDFQKLKERLTTKTRRRRFEPKLLLRDISRDMVAKITAQRYKLPGVVISVVPTRDYLYGDLAAHVIGYIREISSEQLKHADYAGYRMGDMIGQYGIEYKLESSLRGEPGLQHVIVNAMGNKIGEDFFKPEIPGHDVTLTIDRKLQQAADNALAGKKGAVVALDVRTGEVLAMASSPRFSPALFASEMTREAWSDLQDPKSNKLSNRALQGTYPPGSVFKIFVAAAALAESVITPHDRIFCGGAMMMGSRAFRCHKHSGHGSVNLFEAIVQSCDVYFYTVGQRLGVDRIHKYAHDIFGFGSPTGIDLGEENKGLIPSEKWKAEYFRKPEDKKWYPGETLPVSIGQGAVTVTPLQVAVGLASVVNGGTLLEPRIKRSVVANDGRPLLSEDGAKARGKALDDPAILEQLRKAMVGVVVDKRGTGHRAALPETSGIVVGGKTGTSQVASRDAAVQEEDHAWFAGYAPADKPEIVVVALYENGGHGGVAAAPIVREVLSTYFHLDEVNDVALNGEGVTEVSGDD
jgi:penicillin-binding protein 2